MNISLKVVGLGLMLHSLAGFGYEYEAMQCTIRGCTDGEVKVTHAGSERTFEFLTKNYLTNPVNDEFTRILKSEHLIGPNDRVDYLSFEIADKDCKESRDKQRPLFCNGTANYLVARIRENELYLSESNSNRFKWKSIRLNPIDFELNTLPVLNEPAQYLWSFAFKTHSGVHEGYPQTLYQCRYFKNPK